MRTSVPAAAMAATAGIIASGLVLSTAMPASASSAPAKGRTLTLPAPTGRYATGESTFRLVDDHRADPWVPSQPYRELMISVFYPAAHAAGKQVTNQFPAADAGLIGPAIEQNNTLPPGLVDWAATR